MSWRRRKTISLGVATVAIVLAGLPAVAARDDTRDANAGLNGARPGPGLLTFESARGGLCFVRGHGSQQVRLTRRWRTFGRPTWSPDGRYVAVERLAGYDSNRDPVTKVVVADSRGRVRWTFGAGNRSNNRPLWSPDGRHIAYFAAWAHVYSLDVARPNGSGETGLAGSPAWPTYGPANPAWAADGRRVAFSDGGTPAGNSIFSVRVDGGDRRLLVPGAAEPAFSPDGSQLAYPGRGNIVVAGADGSNPRAIMPPSTDPVRSPTWSPDGTHIAFRRGLAIAVVNVDGRAERIVTSRADSVPEWSQNGKSIAFSRGKTPGSSRIVVAKADGSGERIVARRAFAPTWRPAVALPTAKRPPCR